MTYTPQKKHDPIDPDVKLPAAIRAAAARSEALHQENYTPPAEDPKKDEPKKDDVQNGSAEGEQKTPKPENAPAPKNDAPAGDPPASEDEEDFKHKYNSLKPRFDRQNDMIRDLNARMNQMQRELDAAKKAPAPPARTNENTFKAISPEDREAYGDDFLDVAARAAQEKLNPEFEAMRRELAELKGTIGGVTQQTKEQVMQSMYTTLDQGVPNWREINRDPNFIAWTNLPDPFSGATRITLLTDAYNKGESQRVMQFFKGFLQDEAATDPVGRKPEPPKGKVPLETFAAPGRAKAPAAQEAPGEKETITSAQIAQFYLDVQKGKYKGDEATKNDLERRIYEAQAEGRVLV